MIILKHQWTIPLTGRPQIAALQGKSRDGDECFRSTAVIGLHDELAWR
jgi:hypothetical protein